MHTVVVKDNLKFIQLHYFEIIRLGCAYFLDRSSIRYKTNGCGQYLENSLDIHFFFFQMLEEQLKRLKQHKIVNIALHKTFNVVG